MYCPTGYLDLCVCLNTDICDFKVFFSYMSICTKYYRITELKCYGIILIELNSGCQAQSFLKNQIIQ